MVTLTVTPDQDAIVGEVQIGAPPERVFQALTDPRQLLKWWGQAGLYRCTDWQTDVRVGGKWKSVGRGDTGVEFTVEGEYLELDPPRALAYTWRSSWAQFRESRVRWELIPQASGTLAKIRHSGLSGDPEAMKSYSGGWPRVVAWMKAFVETGETVDTRKPVSAA